MKHLKCYEQENKHRYYKINVQHPYLKELLKKIGMNDGNIKKWSARFERWTDDYVYLFDENGRWGWCKIVDLDDALYDNSKNYVYMGIADIAEYEINANKYKI